MDAEAVEKHLKVDSTLQELNISLESGIMFNNTPSCSDAQSNPFHLNIPAEVIQLTPMQLQ
jgi:hypothetical protein